MDEKRETLRSKAFSGAQIVFNQRNSTISCLVRNISKTGARLEFDAPSHVPDTFELKVNGKPHEFRAEVVWRKGTSVGVRFRLPEPSGLPGAP